MLKDSLCSAVFPKFLYMVNDMTKFEGFNCSCSYQAIFIVGIFTMLFTLLQSVKKLFCFFMVWFTTFFKLKDYVRMFDNWQAKTWLAIFM